MTLNISLTTWKAKVLAALVTFAVSGLLVAAALWYLVIATLSEERIPVPREVLAAAVEYFPNSPRLHARLAAAEFYGTERDLANAERHAREAIRLVPNEYTYHLRLALILEAAGNRDAAEQAFRDAHRLAPNYGDVNWRLANVLVRQGKAKESLDHFRKAAASNPGYLPSAHDLIWNVSGGSVEEVTYLTGANPHAQLLLAQFLLGKGRLDEAVAVYSRLDRAAQRSEDESARFLNQMIAANHIDAARRLWLKLMTDKPEEAPAVWNGSFEGDITPALAHFDWRVSSNDYARVAVDPNVGRTGSRSLRVVFSGRDTTRLTDQISQLVPVKPGAKYRLECFYKTRELLTPMGPRVVVLDRNFQNVLAASPELPEGSRDWQQVSLEFTAPPGAVAVVISLQRIPKYDYDNPTRGVVWLDDFTLREQAPAPKEAKEPKESKEQ
jgi:tetratricopeptide (TPR) repeat protein